MPKWKDKTKGYSDDTVESSEVKVGQYRLIVHRHIHYSPDAWLGSCSPLFSAHLLSSTDLTEAKAECAALLEIVLSEALADLAELSKQAA
jgi:hypothetical protein